MCVERQEEIDRLKSRLDWESGGPLAHLANQVVDAFVSIGESVAAWVGREARSGRSSACCSRSSWASARADGGRAVRNVNLLRVAFDAELLRLRAMMARQGRRAAFAVIALIFALVVLALAGATGWLALRHRFEPIPATLILLAFNLVIAAIFGVLTARSSPGHTEQKALRVRRQALDAAQGAPAFMPLTFAVNSLNRAMGNQDLYPFVLSPTVIGMLGFVHEVVHARR